MWRSRVRGRPREAEVCSFTEVNVAPSQGVDRRLPLSRKGEQSSVVLCPRVPRPPAVHLPWLLRYLLRAQFPGPLSVVLCPGSVYVEVHPRLGTAVGGGVHWTVRGRRDAEVC